MVERGACSSGSDSGSGTSSNNSGSGCNERNASTVNGVSNVVAEGGIAGVVFEGARLEELTSLRRASGARFSLFKWFKRAGGRSSTIEKRRKVVDKIAVRGNKDDRGEDEEEEDNDEENDGRGRSVSSSAESINTFYSTTTVRSFAFHSGAPIDGKELSLDILKQAAEVGPFAAGASKVVGNKENNVADVACTLPSNVHSRRRDITARYSLQPTTSFASCGNLPLPEGRTLSGSLRRLQDRGKEGGQLLGRRKVHVKGKRRAPNPPDVSRNSVEVDARVDAVPKNSNRRKRRAPRPPPERDTEGKGDSLSLEERDKPRIVDGGMDVDSGRKQEEGQVIGNDTLVLQGGVLHSRKDLKQSPKLSKSPTASGNSSGGGGGGGCGGGAGGSGANCGIVAITQDTPNVQAAVVGATGTLSTAMPRPWYKRSVFEHSRDSAPSRRGDVLRVSAAGSIDSKEECVGTHTVSSSSTSSGLLTGSSSTSYSVDASLSRLSFFHRGERQAEDRKRDVKRKSGLSILTNISELDKEAAAIVQEEQARARASMLLKSSKFSEAFERRHEMNEELVQDMVASAMETSSPKRGTRALISKFNAISNITKVTVNANFFARRDQQGTKFEQDVIRNARFEQTEWKENSKFQRASAVVGESSSHVDKDISRYFLPQQRRTSGIGESKEIETRMVSESKFTPRKDNNDRLIKETSSRISFLQSQLVANRMNEPLTSRTESTVAAVPATEGKIKSKQEILEEVREKERKTDNPTLSGLASFSKPRGLAVESVENASGVGKDSRKPADRGNVETVQKEFSNIFEEIDRQLRITREPRRVEPESRRDAKDRVPALVREEREKVDKAEKAEKEKDEEEKAKGKEKEKEKEEEGISSKVTKVLDILVEAEKDGKAKKAITRPTRSIFTEEETTEVRLNEPDAKFGKTKSSLLNTVENPRTTDLKEMLKEMKHSLPKRPKPKKRTIEEENGSGLGGTRIDVEVVPSTSKISYVAKSVLKKEASPLAARHDYEMDKQKVSSSSQTSGNVRRLNQPSTSSSSSSSSGWRQEDVLYRTSGKSVAGLALAKNTFQLIRPRDFAEIEAIKATKGQYKENTYANVIERSLYANALVPPLAKQRDEYTSRVKGELGSDSGKGLPNSSSPSNERKFSALEDRFATTDEEDVSTEKNMNTLAINRLLRKLEAAIASGHHQQAAGLAKELARLKIHCSVIRQRTARLKDRAIKVNMYIEDKLAHQGPIPLQLPTRMTVAELKTKVYTEFEIPTNVQRWIIGKNLADYDEATLEELQAVDGSPIFLYLVAPELQKDSAVQADKSNSVEELQKVEKEVPPRTEEKVVEEDEEVEEEEEEEEEENARSINVRNDVVQVEAAEEQTPEEAKMERYEELISLENCDVIPNSEPIECPICFVTYGPREGVILRDCLHMFCKACIANTIKYCEEAEVKCPYRDTEYTCESTLQEREIKALVEPEVYQQHLAKSITQAESNAGNNAFHCKTPDCPGWCYYDDDVNNFLCPVCGINNCLTCQAAHIGKNCKQYQQELRLSKETDQDSRRTAAMLEEMVDRGEALACPTCAIVLMKKWGCDWLRCSMCKTEICWVTKGPRWGPGGKGDTSGGCRCGENGVKCHPRCNYCH